MKKSFLGVLCIVFVACVSNAADIKGLDLKRNCLDNQTISMIRDSNFEDVNIAGAHLQNATIDHLTMKRGIIAGTDFSGATISNSTFTDIWPWYWGASAKFTNTKITNTTFENIDFGGIDFTGSQLTDITFKNCVLTNTIFNNCKFTNIKVDCCNLTNASFDGCGFKNVDMSNSYYYERSEPKGLAILKNTEPKHIPYIKKAAPRLE